MERMEAPLKSNRGDLATDSTKAAWKEREEILGQKAFQNQNIYEEDTSEGISLVRVGHADERSLKTLVMSPGAQGKGLSGR